MSAVTRVLSSSSLRTGVLVLATLAGAASALGMPDRDDHGRDRWRYGRDDWRSRDSGSRSSFALSVSSGYSSGYGSGSAIGFSYSSGYRSGYGYRPGINNCAPVYRPIFAAPYCPPPIRRVVVEQPVYYSQPVYAQPIYQPVQQVVYSNPAPVVVQQPQVIYQPAPVVIQQPAPQVVVQQPAPAPAPQVVVNATTTPAPAAPTRLYRDVAPNDLSISAFRTGDTIMVLVSGTNSMEGYSTSLSINDVQSDATLVLHNEPPLVTQNLRNTAFNVNASIRLSNAPKTIGVKVAEKVYQVPVTEVASVNDSNAN